MLRAINAPCHWFREPRQHVWRGKLVTRLVSVFPRYLIASPLALSRCYSGRTQINGLHGPVRFGNEIATLSDELVAAMVAASVDDVMPARTVAIASRFEPGDQVRILGDHLLAGQSCRFCRMLAPAAAVVEIDMLGGWLSLPVDDRELELVSRPKKKPKRRRPPRHVRYRNRLASQPTTQPTAGL